MQNTRLNTILNQLREQLTQWARMPWRRLSLMIISLLFGNFLASVVSTTTGQQGRLDVLFALALTIGVETISWLVYSRLIRQEERLERAEETLIRFRRPLWLEVLNANKLGFVYGLFLEAFKLGS